MRRVPASFLRFKNALFEVHASFRSFKSYRNLFAPLKLNFQSSVNYQEIFLSLEIYKRNPLLKAQLKLIGSSVLLVV